MDALSPLEIIYVVVILITSFAIRGSAGFGGLNGPLLMVVLPAKVVVPGLVFLGIVSSGAIVYRDHRHIEWPAVWRTLPFGIAGTVIGLWLFKTLHTHAIERGLGVFLCCYGMYALWRTSVPLRAPAVAPNFLAAVMGTASGIVGTVFGAMAGLFVAVFLDLLKLAKFAFRATMAATLMTMGLFRAAGYLSVGAITSEVLTLVAVAMPLIGIGVMLGHRMHASLNQTNFNRFVGALFVVIGVFLAVR
jgi:hypothetical protein